MVQPCWKYLWHLLNESRASPVAQTVKNLQCMRPGFAPWIGRSPEKEMATYSSILAWRIPWTEEPGGPQSLELQRVGHD